MAVLENLYKLYEVLVEKEDIPAYTWAFLRVSYAIDLDDDGGVNSLMPLMRIETDEQAKKSKEILEPIKVPLPYKRSSGVKANFLCDNSSYLFGIDGKGKPERAKACFEAAAALHQEVLSRCHHRPARAVLNYFANWDVEDATAKLSDKPYFEDIMRGVNLIFAHNGRILNEDQEIAEAWQAYFSKNSSADAEQGQCLVTGKQAPIARLHPNIKGVVGAQSSGASLVSFNAPAYESYGQEQGGNAPVGVEASLAYGAALNYLLADRENKKQLGDTGVVYWAENAEKEYSTLAGLAISPEPEDIPILDKLQQVMSAIERGNAIDLPEGSLKSDEPFYVLGLAPNASRLSVRFFIRGNFGDFLDNLLKHHERTLIDRYEEDPYKYMPLWLVMRETVNRNARTPKPRPNLSAELLNAVLHNRRYPRSLFTDIQARIKAEQGAVNANRAAIMKAYLLRNLPSNHQAQEVLNMKLNRESNYMPYVLGRIFALLERTQKDAAYPSKLNTTIKDRYFTSACSTPASVFPYLLRLNQHHQKKLEDGARVNVEKQLQDMFGKLETSLPKHLPLEDQGIFQIGYYHQIRDFWNMINAKKGQKKEENHDERN